MTYTISDGHIGPTRVPISRVLDSDGDTIFVGDREDCEEWVNDPASRALSKPSFGEAESPRFSWTQPACADCWNARNPDRRAHTFVEAVREICVYCGRMHRSGIYVRVDPATAPHPTNLKD